MSDTVEIPIPSFAANGTVAKKPKRLAKAAAAPEPVALEALSLNSALAEIESARTPRKPADKAKRPPPRYVRKRP